MSKKRTNLILCISSLIVGGFLYIILRPTTYVAQIFNSITIINSIQNKLSILDLNFCKYYLPDYLWSFSLCCGLVSIFNPQKTGLLICATLTFMCGSTWELLQYANVLSGTFDFWDILMYLIAVVFTVLINIKE